jgi:hypothetical protein
LASGVSASTRARTDVTGTGPRAVAADVRQQRRLQRRLVPRRVAGLQQEELLRKLQLAALRLAVGRHLWKWPPGGGWTAAARTDSGRRTRTSAGLALC